MAYIVLGVPWCDINVLNVHAIFEEKSNDAKDSFDDELKQVLSVS